MRSWLPLVMMVAGIGEVAAADPHRAGEPHPRGDQHVRGHQERAEIVHRGGPGLPLQPCSAAPEGRAPRRGCSSIAVGIRYGLTQAWLSLVTVELLAASEGVRVPDRLGPPAVPARRGARGDPRRGDRRARARQGASRRSRPASPLAARRPVTPHRRNSPRSHDERHHPCSDPAAAAARPGPARPAVSSRGSWSAATSSPTPASPPPPPWSRRSRSGRPRARCTSGDLWAHLRASLIRSPWARARIVAGGAVGGLLAVSRTADKLFLTELPRGEAGRAVRVDPAHVGVARRRRAGEDRLHRALRLHPVVVNTYEGVRSVGVEHIEVARVLRLSRWADPPQGHPAVRCAVALRGRAPGLIYAWLGTLGA